MPFILENPVGGSSGMHPGAKYDYSYPNGLDLSPDGELHKYLVGELKKRIQESYTQISRRHGVWKKIDRTLTAYVQPDEKESKIKAADERRPISIVVPYSYATLETLLTYFVTVFLDDPIFQYEGVSPEDILGAALLERAVDVQARRAKMALSLYTFFRDGLAYGIGGCAPIWTQEMGFKTVKEPLGFMSSLLGKWFSFGEGKRQEEIVKYEGNVLNTLDPYMMLPDPNVPIHEHQKGEFFGWGEETNYAKLLEQERNNGDLFNVRYCNDIGSGKSQYVSSRSNTGRDDRFGGGTDRTYGSSVFKPMDAIHIYMNLIPSEWRLGSRKYPEKWLFTLVGDKIIVRAKPLGLDHNMFPVALNAPTFDGHSVAPISKVEVVYGLQETLDWLFSSHIANVRKAINDMLIVDPSMINMSDLKEPEPGKLVRLRRAAWGKDVRASVFQLQIQDITKGHIQDSSTIVELVKQISGSQDAVMGVQRKTSDRITAEEVQQTAQGALSRLATMAKVSSMMGLADLSYMIASHTQQLMSQDLYLKMTGRWPEYLQQEYPNLIQGGRLKVSPFDILVDYDVVNKDGTMSIAQNAQIWSNLFQTIAQQPLLLQRFDIVKIFKMIAKGMGAKNVDEFELKQMPAMQAQVMPDENVMREAEKGNLIPLEGGTNVPAVQS
jgi:hypothetical protein